MNKIVHFISYLIIITFSCFTIKSVQAQLPTANAKILYLINGNDIWNFDPTMPPSATNPVINTIQAPTGAQGLAVGENINAVSPRLTFYTIVSNEYYYYDGTAWVNTGHTVGNTAAVNPGIGGGYIYNLVGSSGEIYRYDGTANGILLTTIAGFNAGGPFDVVVDCQGNFFILKLTNPQYLRKYDPNGVQLQEWNMIGFNAVGSGGGFGIIDDKVYVYNSSFSVGQMDATSVTLINNYPSLSPSPSDFATLPHGYSEPQGGTIYICGGGKTFDLRSTGSTSVTWTIESGNAFIVGSGQDIEVGAYSNSVITAKSLDDCTGQEVIDRFDIRIPVVHMNAGNDYILEGCGIYRDTLHGSFSILPSHLDLDFQWSTDNGSFVSGDTTQNPIIDPSTSSNYYFSVSSELYNGLCVWEDSIHVEVQDNSTFANFNIEPQLGCSSDTVQLINLSEEGKYFWNFYNGQPYDTTKNPQVVYDEQGEYLITLIVENDFGCRDTLTRSVDLNHPLKAQFIQSEDSICQNADNRITFTDQSIGTVNSWLWDFGDSTISQFRDPAHRFTKAGEQTITLIVKDLLGCQDTTTKVVYIDSLPNLELDIDKYNLCRGDEVNFQLSGYPESTSINWNFGDGTFLNEPGLADGSMVHSYEANGNIYLNVTVTSLVCEDVSYLDTIVVNDFPYVDLGSDSALCLDGNTIVLENLNSLAGTGNIEYLWSTGDTTEALNVTTPGNYTLTVTRNGCASTEEMNVYKDCFTNIPNAFSPNGDGDNDYFFPRQLLTEGVTEFSMSIYNRWGQKIYETISLNGRGWDGKFNDKEQPMGVYIYQIDVRYKNGRTENYTGNLTLLR